MYKMKQILFLVIVFIATFGAKGQTVTVRCQGGAGITNCFLTDPEPFVTIYVADINDGDKTVSNGWNRSFPDWFPVGGAVGQPSSGVQTSVAWLNTPNTPQKTIQVKVTYKKAGQTDVVVQNTQNVTVKHIGKIMSATIQNGNPATLTGSGLTTQIPCGIAPFTVTVPTPVTSPTQSVNYSVQWTNGWNVSGVSASSNVFTVTPLAGGDGSITINAKRTDGTVFQSFNVGFSRAASVVGDPTLNLAWGGPIVCVGETRFVTGVAANATSFVWAPVNTASLYAPSTNVNYAYVQFNSTTTLTLTVSNGCGQSKTVSEVIKVGPPTISPTVNNGPLQIPNYIQNPGFMALNPNQSGLTFNWEILNGTGNIYQSGYGQVYAYAYPFLRVQGTATNVCGSSSATFYLSNVSSGYYRMVSSNPTQNTISVEMEKELGQLALVSVKLVSHGRNAVERSFTAEDARRTNHFEKSNKIDFDVSNLPRGTYYLLIDFKESKTMKEIIVLN
jgi:hypothetical protein